MSLTDTQTDHHADTTSEADEKALALKIILTVLFVLVAWGLAIFMFGVPGLYIPAVAVTPVMYIILITIARGG